MVDQAKGYPPWIREVDVAYDRAAGRAKVVVTKGLNAGKTFLRLYGSKREYMIRDGEYPACRRSYLGEQNASLHVPCLRLMICVRTLVTVLLRLV